MTDRTRDRITRTVLGQLSDATPSQLTQWIDHEWLPSVNGKTGKGNHRTFLQIDVLAASIAVEASRDFGPEAAGRVLLRFKAALAGGATAPIRSVRAYEGETVEIAWQSRDGAVFRERRTIPPVATRRTSPPDPT